MSMSFTIQALLGLLFFSVLLTTGTSLQCDTCKAEATSCTDKKVNCTEAEDICYTITTVQTVEGKNVTTTERGCSTKATCEREKKKVGTTVDEVTYKAVECSKAPLTTASFLLVLSGLPLLKILL